MAELDYDRITRSAPVLTLQDYLRGHVVPASAFSVCCSGAKMSTFVFLIAGALFTGSIVCGICYGVAIRDYGQRIELGHMPKSRYCVVAMNEAGRCLAIGATIYVLGVVVLAGVFWYS